MLKRKLKDTDNFLGKRDNFGGGGGGGVEWTECYIHFIFQNGKHINMTSLLYTFLQSVKTGS